jgi:peroxiredoxin
MEQKSRSRILILILVAFVVAAAGAAIYFWRQNAQLRDRLQASSPKQQAKPADVVRRVAEGDLLPEFTAVNIDGREVRVAPQATGNTLLFIYDPSCDRCEAGIPNWIKLNDKLKELHSSARVIALSIADSYPTVQHARKMKLPFTVVPFPSVELQKKYGVTEVPLTVVVDPQGKVQAVWDKPLDEGEVGDVIETVCPECLERVRS